MLHVVGHQFAHVAARRHGPPFRPGSREPGSRFRGTRRVAIRYSKVGTRITTKASSGQRPHASDRVRPAGIPGKPAAGRRAGVSRVDPAVPRFVHRRRRLDHRQPGAGRRGGAGCLAGGLCRRRQVRGAIQPGHLGVQHRAQPGAHTGQPRRPPGRAAQPAGWHGDGRPGGRCQRVQAGRPLARGTATVGRTRPGANRGRAPALETMSWRRSKSCRPGSGR